MKHRAQSAVEFMVILGAVLFFLASFFLFFYGSYSDKAATNRNEALLEIALDVQNELALAARTGEGYSRTFTLPQTVYGQDYTVQIIDTFLYLKTSDEKNALGVPIVNATGIIIPGSNLVSVQGGRVHVN